jgi:hypothetical protein
VPEDRLGDLDPTERRRGAAERLAELDSREPEAGRPDARDPPRRPGSRYGWVVAVAAFVLITYALLTTFQGGTGEGNSGPEVGEQLPDFAAPTLRAETEAPPNVGQGETPPCAVEGVDVVNICDLREKGPMVLTFVVLGELSDTVRCEDALDQVERVREDFPDVEFVGVLTSASAEEVEEILATHDWGFPVANDPDGALQTTYRVGDCPVTVLAEEGGEVAETINGFLSLEELKTAVRRVSSGSERAAS